MPPIESTIVVKNSAYSPQARGSAATHLGAFKRVDKTAFLAFGKFMTPNNALCSVTDLSSHAPKRQSKQRLRRGSVERTTVGCQSTTAIQSRKPRSVIAGPEVARNFQAKSCQIPNQMP
jgi:hypothetical protein